MYTAQGKINQDVMLEKHYPLVRRQALALLVRLPASVELDDLIQAGMVGLLDALSRYDSSAGATFATFANLRIRGAMVDELRTRDWLPRSVRRSARDMDSCIHALEQRLGRPPEEREIAAELGISLAEYHQLLADINSGYLMPYEELLDEQGDTFAEDTESVSPLKATLDAEQRELLIEAVAALPEREKLLMALYYQEELNLKEIGAVLGVSESRVSQLHSQAVSRLRGKLAER